MKRCKNGGGGVLPTQHLDADDGDGHWVTTKEGNHMFIDGEGNPTKGNPHVLAAAKGESGSKKPPSDKKTGPSSGSTAKRLNDSVLKAYGKGDNRKVYEAAEKAMADLPVGGTVKTNGTTYTKTGDGMFSYEYKAKDGSTKTAPLRASSVLVQVNSLDKNEAPVFSEGSGEPGKPSNTGKTNKSLTDSVRSAYNKNDNQKVYQAAEKALEQMPIGGKVFTNGELYTKEEDGRFIASSLDHRGKRWGLAQSSMLVQINSLDKDEAPIFYDPD